MHPDDLAFLRFRLLRGARLVGPASARVTAVPLWALSVPLQVSSVAVDLHRAPPLLRHPPVPDRPPCHPPAPLSRHLGPLVLLAPQLPLPLPLLLLLLLLR